MTGKFITFEGPEGSGKTTQASLLVGDLKGQGHEVLYAREPGGTPTGEAIREILQYDKTGEPISPETEVLLFASSRAQLVRHVIIPALEKGTHVICDRFADSTTAYQGYGRGFPISAVRFLMSRFFWILILSWDFSGLNSGIRIRPVHRTALNGKSILFMRRCGGVIWNWRADGRIDLS